MRRIIYFTFSLLALCMIGSTRAVADDDLTGQSPATTLTDGGYYYIVSNKETFYNSQGKHVAFYYDESDAGNVYWNQISTSDPNFVFQLVKKDDNVWTIRNCASNQYIKGSAYEVATFGLGEYEHTFYPQSNGSYKIRNASISNSNYYLYTDNSSYGANTKNLVGCNHWSANLDEGTYANWDFYEVNATIAAEAEALGAENAATFVTEIEDGAFYYIVNDYHHYTNKYDVDIAFWNEADNLRWKQLDVNDYNYIFKATKDTDGKVALQSVIGKKYVGVGSPAAWLDEPYYHVVTDEADATYAPYLGTGTGLFKIVNSDGSGRPLGPGCIVCGDAVYANVGQESHTPDNGGYGSATNGYVGRWKFYKVPQNKVDALLYGIPVTDLSQLSDDKYYYIISQHDDFRHLGSSHSAAQNNNGYEGALGYNENVTTVAWFASKRAEPDPNAVWRIIKDGEYYKLLNTGNEKYAGVASSGVVSWTDACEQTQKFMTSNIAGAFEISNSNHTYRWGIGGSYHVSNYGVVGSVGGSDLRNAWKIYELTDAQVQGMCNTLTQELQAAVSSGVGVVSGIKDDASMTAAQAVLAASPDYDALKQALDNYVMNLTTGYWRIQNENGSKEYMTVKPAHTFDTTAHDVDPYDYVMCDALDDAIYSDFSTVWTITDKGDGTYTMSSQGLYHANRYAMAHPNMAVALQSQAMKYGSYSGTGKVWIQVSQESGSWTSHPYIMKNPSNTDKRVNCYYTIGGGEATLKWTIRPAEFINITLHENNSEFWGTLYVPFGVTLPPGNEAFVGKLGENSLTLTSIGQNIPAGTPVVIKGNAGIISADLNADIEAYTGDNDLKGQYLAAEAADETKLALGKYNGKVGFYKYTDALGANKAYLEVSSSSPSAGFQFVFDDDDITGINAAQSSMLNGQSYYDLFGRKVAAPQKGHLYIQNGKVVKY